MTTVTEWNRASSFWRSDSVLNQDELEWALGSQLVQSAENHVSFWSRREVSSPHLFVSRPLVSASTTLSDPTVDD